jgi:hypothetical protein
MWRFWVGDDDGLVRALAEDLMDIAQAARAPRGHVESPPAMRAQGVTRFAWNRVDREVLRCPTCEAVRPPSS